MPEESFVEPGSQPRNPRLADVFRELRLAENKGTGIGAVRRTMDSAGLTPPVFESDRRHNRGRRTGAVRNAMLRDISRLDTLGASLILRQLRDRGLLESKGSDVATHYVLGLAARGAAAEPVANRGELGEGLSPIRRELGADRGELDRQELGADRHELEADRQELPPDLIQSIQDLGPRPRQELLRNIIVRLCVLRPMTPVRLGQLLSIRPENLSRRHLWPMTKEGLLERTHPDNPRHPKQAYRARQ